MNPEAEAQPSPGPQSDASAGRDLPPLDGGSAANTSTPIGTPSRRPMPGWMPYVLLALLVVVGAAAAMPILSSRRAEAPDPVPALQSTPADAPSLEDQLADAREAAAAVAREQQEAQAIFDAALIAVRQDLSRLSDEVRALQAAVEADRRAAQDASAPGVEGEVLRAAIDSLALQLDDVLTRSRTVQQAASPPARPPRRVAVRPVGPPPFEILALDIWGGEPQMTVRDATGIRLLASGQSVDGWRLAAADAGRGVLTLQAPSGRSAAYTLTGSKLAAVPPAPLPTLTVAAEPADARVRVMNVGPAYRDRMPLPPGAYDVLVDRPGYLPSRQWVRLDADRVLSVRLAPQAADEASR